MVILSSKGEGSETELFNFVRCSHIDYPTYILSTNGGNFVVAVEFVTSCKEEDIIEIVTDILKHVFEPS